ncbi:hypothetical protein P170DRAFT_36338 [Aspergillus steynii IBT 23096]|uniref:Uncharacterized protein n=1 Tax=Aspergillus steynii IBT 23096 TaxID=1392250 RepID=A0A2I2GQU1_9EURO|nr:uncharacterized protein P170DRAFT_36338 [Aspergillus steynii IBT 23096]PLB55249.1 hypothetical protein P170DRAFT_36338 [Aspergillus steynii IBT 23096]
MVMISSTATQARSVSQLCCLIIGEDLQGPSRVRSRRLWLAWTSQRHDTVTSGWPCAAISARCLLYERTVAVANFCCRFFLPQNNILFFSYNSSTTALSFPGPSGLLQLGIRGCSLPHILPCPFR